MHIEDLVAVGVLGVLYIAAVGASTMLPLEDQMPEVVVLDVLESCRCVFIHLFVLKLSKHEKGNTRGWCA